MLKNIPNSVSDFKLIRSRNLLYIDKTKFIKAYESLESYVSLFLRPRRFGKTLFTEILYYYYDISQKDLFDKLFSGTYIHEKTTPYKSSYAVVRFDFAGIKTDQSVSDILNDFRVKVIRAIFNFYENYKELIPTVIKHFAKEHGYELMEGIRAYYRQQNSFPSASSILEDFLLAFKEKQTSYKLMFIIDEYDNFTNDILSRDKKAFIDLVNKQSEIGAFYGVIRSYNQESTIERVFITGILPITMDTMISGFVSSKISQEPILNELAGFTDSEVLELLHETVDFTKCRFAPDTLQTKMKEWFNGYRFANKGLSKVYNSTLCLNFVNSLRKDGDNLPKLSVSSNMDIDFSKLSGYLNLIHEESRKKIIEAIVKEAPIPFTIPDNIKLDRVDNSLSYGDGLALLFYLGFLTIMNAEDAKEQLGDYYDGSLYLKVPNSYFRVLFAKYLVERARVDWSLYIDSNTDVLLMGKRNDLSGLIQAFSVLKGALVKSDITHESEAVIVMGIYAIIALKTNCFELIREYVIKHNNVMVSDCVYDLLKSTVGRHKRADLVAINKEGGPSYLFEFKYQRNENSSLDTKEKVRAKLLNDAKEQIKFYQTDDKLKTIKDLHKYVIMYTYDELTLEEIL
ncbi:MAG: AAA family ATPase [Succinivibrio sp.]|nr:AAA family ATPase [Succinivibrio sp.]MDY5905203.1 AAA family ATPase [Succinivibrio sp.]